MGKDRGKTAVILLAFGGADSVENVEEFIKNIFKGRPVPPALIEDAKRRYRLIGGSSPLLKITEAQAKALEELLDKKEGRYPVFVGMLNWHPFIKDTIKEIGMAGIKEAAAIIMAPHSTPASTGGYKKAVGEALKETGSLLKVEFLENWHTHPLYIDAIMEKLNEALQRFPSREDVLTVFSAHSLPIEALKNDPYVEKIEETIREIVARVPLDWRLGYQSRGQSKGRHGEWLGPSVEDVIKEAKATGKKGVLVLPVGFISDHVETLYDIDILFKETARAQGLDFQRAASLNTSERFIEMLSAIVLKTRTHL